MLLPLILVLSTTIVSAQTVIDYSKIPACAQQCTVLAQAQGGCVPPAAQVTNQETYQSCFCQSAFLTSLKTSPSLCENVCSTADATAIEQWYVALCNGPVVQPADTTTTTKTTATTATTTSTNTATGTVLAPGNKGANGANTPNSNWFANHWKWVVMLIVIFVAIVFFWILGIWLKRRHNRKRDARGGNLAAPDAFIVDHPPPPPSSARPNGTLSKEIGMPPPMTMSGARGSMGIDGVGGIAPPRSARVRSRSNTLSSMTHGNAGQPIAWGPHQNQAHGSPINSVPPSPTVASPSPIYMNERARVSEPRFGPGYGAAAGPPGRKGISVETTHHPSPMNPSPVSPIDESRGMLGVPGQGPRAFGAPAGAQRIREMRSKESVGHGSLGRGAAAEGGGGDGVGRKMSKKLNKRNSSRNS